VSTARAPSLKAQALRWLAQRDHSRAELRRKLLGWLEAQAPGSGNAAGGTDDDSGGTGDSGADAQADPGEARRQREERVDELLEWLATHRYLDERRFAESRIHARAARFGHRRIENELQQHGVALDGTASAALRASELARAREVWTKRFGAAPADAAERARQMRFLAGRGFSAEVIRKIVRADGAYD
jgi:regulatory protein